MLKWRKAGTEDFRPELEVSIIDFCKHELRNIENLEAVIQNMDL